MPTSRNSSSSCCGSEKSNPGASDNEIVAWPFDNFVGPKGSQKLKITYCFVDHNAEKQEAVLQSIKQDRLDKLPSKYDARKRDGTWEKWANILFEEAPIEQANIRIGFDEAQSPQNWSCVGFQASKYPGKVTLNLGDIDSREIPLDKDYGVILHEFGHALGLEHEHQSPDRDPRVDKSDRSMWSASPGIVEDQVMRKISRDKILRMTDFDVDSIMMYPIKGLKSKFSTKLSKLDKSFIMLVYPPDLSTSKDISIATDERLSRFKEAMRDLHIPNYQAGKILNALSHPKSALESGGNVPDLASRLQAARELFFGSNELKHSLQSKWTGARSQALSTKQYALPLRAVRSIDSPDPTLMKAFGMDPLADIARNRLFQSLMRQAVRKNLMQRGIPIDGSISSVTQFDLAKVMTAICMHDDVARTIKAYKEEFQGSGSGSGVGRRTSDGKGDAEEQPE